MAQALLAQVAGLRGQGVTARITEAWSELIVERSGGTTSCGWLEPALSPTAHPV